MGVSFFLRAILILVLPCIAAVIYIKGQKYDPALIDFKSAANTSSGSGQAIPAKQQGPTSSLPSDIEGFKQFGKIREFNKDNLFEHVNGHAEYFISAGFQKLSVIEYVSSTSRSEKPELQAEVYEMGSGLQAFGVLVDESGAKAEAVNIGAMGFKTSGGISFFKGKYYVKIAPYSGKPPLMLFASRFEKKLTAASEEFSAFSKLPAIGKTIATRFVKEGYRGLDFFKNVIEREYNVDGRTVQIALISGKDKEIKDFGAALNSYLQKSAVSFEKENKQNKEIYKISDKYEGDWFVVVEKTAAFGIFGAPDASILRYFIKEG
ncbi:MAG: hypothetical protein EPN22_15920 [Nitrospirae bacterium]|nr:MAG: hypothetical protein EPN22_15920 [Nitrospirota bacterium]